MAALKVEITKREELEQEKEILKEQVEKLKKSTPVNFILVNNLIKGYTWIKNFNSSSLPEQYENHMLIQEIYFDCIDMIYELIKKTFIAKSFSSAYAFTVIACEILITKSPIRSISETMSR